MVQLLQPSLHCLRAHPSSMVSCRVCKDCYNMFSPFCNAPFTRDWYAAMGIRPLSSDGNYGDGVLPRKGFKERGYGRKEKVDTRSPLTGNLRDVVCHHLDGTFPLTTQAFFFHYKWVKFHQSVMPRLYVQSFEKEFWVLCTIPAILRKSAMFMLVSLLF